MPGVCIEGAAVTACMERGASLVLKGLLHALLDVKACTYILQHADLVDGHDVKST